MAAKFYAVIDTNVVVSAMFKGNAFSNPRKILDLVIDGTITPLLNDEITEEYHEVLSRDKFPFWAEDVENVVNLLKHFGKDHRWRQEYATMR